MVAWLRLVSTFVTVTLAPVTTAWARSRITPVIDPVTSARAALEAKTSSVETIKYDSNSLNRRFSFIRHRTPRVSVQCHNKLAVFKLECDAADLFS